jgi:phosphate uptake regulator
MLSFAGIARNFRFMLLQVKKQLENTRVLLASLPPDESVVKSIRGSEGYIDTQKTMIENECFSFIRKTTDENERTIATVRAVTVISGNLERIADFSVNITRQLQHLKAPERLRPFDSAAYLTRLLAGLDMIEEALFERNSDLALRICNIEDELDRLYHDDFKRVIEELRKTSDVDDYITALFIMHYLERMGDALLNIGEAIIFAVLGERLKVHQYRVLDDAAESAHSIQQPLTDVELNSIWGTRSGVRIGKMIGQPHAGETRRVLFKEGNPEKLKRERESLRRWEDVAPGLVPEVVEYQAGGEGAALLLQYLDGRTLQDVALNGEPALVQRVLDRLLQNVERVWTETRREEPVNGRYLGQLHARLDDVYRLHPELRDRDITLGTLRVPAFGERLAQLAELDVQMDAPFSVFIHGDFNLDNIIYDPGRDSVHYVDVQRSRDMDYVQDASVFCVSAFRLPVLVAATRRKLERLSLGFLGFARDFAARNDDTTFEVRLALGLVRSFVTSTRFELNRRFARNMHQRATLLMRLLGEAQPDGFAKFRVPDSILHY